jgi:pyruvate,water dikinase
MRPNILWLTDRKARNRLIVGGKAANLARLVAEGFPVPKAFVLPVITPPVLSAGWAHGVRKARSRLREPFAVRSSLVGEDDRHKSFAGQLDTVLHVRGEEALMLAIETVRASVSQPRLRRYAQKHVELRAPNSLPQTTSEAEAEECLRIAVLVQEMVPARAAGVAFSADPITGRSTVIVEAVPLLGDDLAQGRAEPDRFLIDPRGVLSHLGRKTLDDKAFPDSVIHDLADLIRRIAACFGEPQDVEWAWNGERIFILQTRPITSLTGKSVYSRKLVGDMTPGPIKHLVWSTNTLGMVEGVFGEVFSRLIGKNEYDFKKILKRIRSRAYVDTTFVGNLLAEVGLPRNLFEAIAREEQLPRRLRPCRNVVFRLPRILTLVWHHYRMAGKLETILHGHDRSLDSFRNAVWDQNPASFLLDNAEDLLRLHRQLQRCVMLGGMNLAVRTRLLKRYLARHVPEVDSADLFLGFRGLKSLEPNRKLQAIAVTAPLEGDDEVSLLLSGSDDAIRRLLRKTDTGKDFLAEFDSFLEQYGFLSANGTNFGEPTWREDPGAVWTALGRMIRNRQPTTADLDPVREAALKTIQHRLGWMRLRRFRSLLSSASRYLELRERISLLMTEDSYQLRRIFLAMGSILAQSGTIEDPEDVFYLDFDEIRDGVVGTGFPSDLNALIRERKEEIAADGELDLPETIVGDDIPSAPIETEAGSVLNGIGVSGGVIQGVARVVKELERAPAHLTNEDVLVVPFSDVGWTPLFATVGGIVAECGGQLSHTAIVAREYGLPAVVGVQGVMTRIRDGQKVTVDGRRGQVHLVEEPQVPEVAGGSPQRGPHAQKP